jgi:hypothetical protein
VPRAWVKIGSFAPAGGPGSGGLTARTDAAGRYRITNVPQMREVAEVYAPGRALAWQWSGGASDPTKARPLALRYGRTTRFDAVLQPEGRIRVVLTGVSSGDGGFPASLAHVQAYTASGRAAVGFGMTVQEDGSHLLRQLPAGTVRLLVRSGPSLTKSSWYDGARSASSATPVTVTVGGTTEVRIAVPVR